MRTIRKPFFTAICAIMVLLWLGLGCEEDTNGPNGPVETDCQTAEGLIVQANDSLANQMDVVINQTLDNPDSSFRPRDIDFTGVYNLYNEAAALCPTNLDAQFGAGFTGLLLYLTDPELNDLIDRIKYVVDTMDANSKSLKPLGMLPLINIGGPMSPDAIPLQAAGFTDALPSLVALDYAVVSAAAADPTIAEIQSNLETQLLPKIVTARNRLATILAMASYTFAITSEMQGNSGADSIVLDRTDFSVFLAVTYAAEAALHVFFARDLDFSPISVAGVEDALNQSSTFLDLKPAGASHMTTAKARITSAKSALVDAIDYLILEIGTDQTYDLIEIPSGGASDLNEFKDSLNYYYDYLVNQKDIDVTIDGTDSVITVDLKQFFDNPMGNPKDFLPGYLLTLEELDSLYIDFAIAHFDPARYWDSLQSIFGLMYPLDTPTFPNHLPDAWDGEFYRLIGENSYYSYGRWQFVFGWDDIQLYCSPTDPYCYWSDNMSEYSNLWYNRDRFEVGVCYTWDANSFTEWTWPDATFNGLLPGMTGSRLKDLIFGDGTDWQKSACDTIHFGNGDEPYYPVGPGF